jgi:hypothetical protein
MERYEDYICLRSGDRCVRGSQPECPQAIATVVSWCKHFVNKKEHESGDQVRRQI